LAGSYNPANHESNFIFSLCPCWGAKTKQQKEGDYHQPAITKNEFHFGCPLLRSFCAELQNADGAGSAFSAKKFISIRSSREGKVSERHAKVASVELFMPSPSIVSVASPRGAEGGQKQFGDNRNFLNSPYLHHLEMKL
jgi:hypothetical protein